jgi:DNA-binding MarR family transcriptional regulator
VTLYIQRSSWHELYALVEELDLTLTQLKVLQVLDVCDDEVSLKGLAEQVPLSLPAASRTVESLLRRGYVERREDQHDRRVKRVRITDDGRGVAMRLNSARLGGLEEFAATLSADERRALSDALSSIVARAEIRACRPRRSAS